MKRLLTSKQMDDFCKAYPCTSNRELAARFGLSGMQVSNIASRRKLKKDAGYHGRILGELIKAERARISQGLPQLTKMRLTLRPRRLYHAASWLLKKNYMIDYDYRIAYYDDKTSRGRWEDTYGDVFKFEKWTDEVAKLYK